MYDKLPIMQILSDTAIKAITGNNQVMGKLMVAFDKHFKTIERWVKQNNVALTTPTAIEIIKEGTGLSEQEILTDKED